MVLARYQRGRYRDRRCRARRRFELHGCDG
jgi:hypothetical protein